MNYAEQYQQAMQTVYKVQLRFTAVYNTPNNSLVKWTGAKTIQVPNITTGGFTDTNRNTIATPTRRVENDWTPYKLEHDREFQTLVDPMDVDETNMSVTIANITSVFNITEKVPEMDKYAASKIHSIVEGFSGNITRDTLTTANILEKFDEFMENMDNAEVPMEGRVLYVTPKTNRLLKQAETLQRVYDVQGGGGATNRSIYSLDAVQIVVVPPARMKTLYDFTDGAVPDPSAELMDMILIHPTALFAPQKYDFVSLDEPTAKTGGKWLYYERKYWDVFGIELRKEAFQINIDTVGA